MKKKKKMNWRMAVQFVIECSWKSLFQALICVSWWPAWTDQNKWINWILDFITILELEFWIRFVILLHITFFSCWIKAMFWNKIKSSFNLQSGNFRIGIRSVFGVVHHQSVFLDLAKKSDYRSHTLSLLLWQHTHTETVHCG